MDVLMHEANKNLDHLVELAVQGHIHSAIEHEYELSEVPLVLQRMCEGRVIGKAVIVIVRD